jgi:hypothetical protein
MPSLENLTSLHFSEATFVSTHQDEHDEPLLQSLAQAISFLPRLRHLHLDLATLYNNDNPDVYLYNIISGCKELEEVVLASHEDGFSDYSDTGVLSNINYLPNLRSCILTTHTMPIRRDDHFVSLGIPHLTHLCLHIGGTHIVERRALLRMIPVASKLKSLALHSDAVYIEEGDDEDDLIIDHNEPLSAAEVDQVFGMIARLERLELVTDYALDDSEFRRLLSSLSYSNLASLSLGRVIEESTVSDLASMLPTLNNLSCLRLVNGVENFIEPTFIISRVLLPSLRHLPNLKSLGLRIFHIDALVSSDIVTCFKDLSRLEVLDFSGCWLGREPERMGLMSIDWMAFGPALDSLVCLGDLDMSCTAFSRIQSDLRKFGMHVRKLTSLQSLRINFSFVDIAQPENGTTIEPAGLELARRLGLFSSTCLQRLQVLELRCKCKESAVRKTNILSTVLTTNQYLCSLTCLDLRCCGAAMSLDDVARVMRASDRWVRVLV